MMGQRIHYPITPCPAPRMTAADKWMKRPCVMRYRAFCNEVKARRMNLNVGDKVIFNIAMPPSWSKKKRDKFNCEPHQQTPDLDNLMKALLDALYEDDSHIWMIWAEKRWAANPSIVVECFT